MNYQSTTDTEDARYAYDGRWKHQFSDVGSHVGQGCEADCAAHLTANHLLTNLTIRLHDAVVLAACINLRPCCNGEGSILTSENH